MSGHTSVLGAVQVGGKVVIKGLLLPKTMPQGKDDDLVGNGERIGRQQNNLAGDGAGQHPSKELHQRKGSDNREAGSEHFKVMA